MCSGRPPLAAFPTSRLKIYDFQHIRKGEKGLLVWVSDLELALSPAVKEVPHRMGFSHKAVEMMHTQARQGALSAAAYSRASAPDNSAGVLALEPGAEGFFDGAISGRPKGTSTVGSDPASSAIAALPT